MTEVELTDPREVPHQLRGGHTVRHDVVRRDRHARRADHVDQHGQVAGHVDVDQPRPAQVRRVDLEYDLLGRRRARCRPSERELVSAQRVRAVRHQARPRRAQHLELFELLGEHERRRRIRPLRAADREAVVDVDLPCRAHAAVQRAVAPDEVAARHDGIGGRRGALDGDARHVYVSPGGDAGLERAVPAAVLAVDERAVLGRLTRVSRSPAAPGPRPPTPPLRQRGRSRPVLRSTPTASAARSPRTG